MLARHVPGAAVLVCDVRATAAALAETALGATVHVLDDGFQHRSLARDVDIVIVSLADLHDRRLPFGRLRSPVSALAQAHAVIVDGASRSEAEAAIATVIDRRRTQLFTLARSLGSPWSLEGAAAGTGRFVAVAGIANPARFAAALESAGYQVAELLGFPDHHTFTRRDVARVVLAVASSGATGVLTTEKDAMRLLPLRPLGVPVAAIPLVVRVEPVDAFRAWLRGELERVRACAS